MILGQPTRGHAGLYLHVPFCSAICPYCDFAVLVGGAARRAAFVGALQDEAAMAAGGGGVAGPFDTVYLGGGTPSLLGTEQLATVLDAVRAALPVGDQARLFLEANPEDVDRRRLAAWRRLGVATLSLGVQAFDDQALRFLGRRHDAAAARRAVGEALEAGFDTVSVDLIYGLPEQTPAAWRRTLEVAVALGPQHLSCYQLTVEPGTPFGARQARGELRPASDGRQAELLLATHRQLDDAGYHGYEVSNFARAPGHRSRHNSKYWQHTPYLGLGPSAHSFDGHRRRWWNERHLARWQRRLGAGERPIAGDETLDDRALILETLMLGLRTADGVDLGRFAHRFAIDLLKAGGEAVTRPLDQGLLRLEDGFLQPSLRGLALAERLATDLAAAIT